MQLGDFGLCRRAVTQTITVGGTDVYMAPEMVARRDRWQALAAQFGVALPAVAFAFAAAPSAVEKLVVGPATPEQVEQNLR